MKTEEEYKEAEVLQLMRDLYPTLKGEERERAERLFPELKESEDERIRKAIHIYLDWLDGRKDYAPKGEYSIRDMIAWLEAQGEQNLITFNDAHIIDSALNDYCCKQYNALHKENGCVLSFARLQHLAMDIYGWCKKQGGQKSFARYKVGDTIYYDSFGRLVSFVIANIVEDGTDNPMYEDKDGNSIFQNDIVEQKPVWSGEDEIIAKSLTKAANDCILYGYVDKHKLLDWLKSLKDRVLPKNEWSKEDLVRIENCISLIGKTGVGEVKWLQSLKDRVIPQPQPKQEWSKEDDYYYGIIQYILNDECVGKTDKENAINWFKSLRPQNTWKPSDEQIEALESATENCAYSEYQGCLRELIEQLKKLREE